MTETRSNIKLGHFLAALPPFLVVDIVDDDAFRAEQGLEVTPTTTVGPLRFRGGSLQAAVASLFKSPDRTAELSDDNGVQCIIEEAEDQDRKLIAIVPNSGDRLLINGCYFQSGDKAERLEELAWELRLAGLPPEACPETRILLEARALTMDEQFELDATLKAGPVAVMEQIAAELEKPQIDLSILIPGSHLYYERLCGEGEALNIDELASDITPPAVDRLLAWDRRLGPRFALALAGHSLALLQTSLTTLPANELMDLADWALKEGDPLAKVAMVELGLEVLPRVPDLSKAIASLVERVLALDTEDDGDLALLNSLFILCLSEFSRLRLLEDWRPFRRRQAALAHAALVTRIASGRLMTSDLFERSAQRFYVQSVVDLRREPRWLPDYATASQLRAELMGRIQGAAGRCAANIPPGPLRKLLLGKSKNSISKAITFPASFYPGPMEGAPKESAEAIPSVYRDILDQTLTADELTPGSVIALINTSSLFGTDKERVQRAVAIIQDAGHRFVGEVDLEKRNALVTGLAAVAAASRSVDLANGVRIMLRKIRVDELEAPDPHVEFLIGATAAAAFDDDLEWTTFVGGMANELAFVVKDRDQAHGLEVTILTLCDVAPMVRTVAGKALAALRAFRRS